MEQNRLKHLRINAGLSVDELALRARTASSTIYAIEKGISKRLHKVTIDRLAEALGVKPEDFYVSFRVIHQEVRRPAAKWKVIIVCPKCRERFRLEIEEGDADPLAGMVSCPICGFSQILSLRRA